MYKISLIVFSSSQALYETEIKATKSTIKEKAYVQCREWLEELGANVIINTAWKRWITPGGSEKGYYFEIKDREWNMLYYILVVEETNEGSN